MDSVMQCWVWLGMPRRDSKIRHDSTVLTGVMPMKWHALVLDKHTGKLRREDCHI